MDADDVRTAEINQPLHRREAVIQGGDSEQQIIAPFVEQTHLTLREYAKTSLDELRRAEADDARFWWRRRV